MSAEIQKYERFITQLGIVPNHNYCMALKYPHKIMDQLSLPLIDSLVYRCELMIFTSEEVIIKRMSSLFQPDTLADYTYKLTRIAKDQLERFELEERTILHQPAGYWLTLKEQQAKHKRYYLLVDNVTLPPFNLSNLIERHFFGLQTN